MIRRAIPSFITCLNLSCGVIAILIPDLTIGVLLILLGAFLDVFDGYFARLLNVQSELGKQLDSLADIVTFGVAPATLYFKLLGDPGSYLTYIGPVILVSAGALRLARYNITKTESNYFEGLAIPSSGILIAGIVLSIEHGDVWFDFLRNGWIYMLIPPIFLAGLNVSKIRMFSVKQLRSHKTVRYYAIFMLVLTILAFLMSPYSAITFLILIYIIIAIIDHLIIRNKQEESGLN